MQGLGSTQHGGKALEGCAYDIVVRVLQGKTPAGGLAMGPQHQGFGLLGIEPAHHVGPQETGSSQHSDIHEKIHSYSEEKGKAWSKIIYIKTGCKRRLHIFKTIGHCKGSL